MPTTVTRTIGPTGDYSTLQAWEDACPANLVTADEIWRGEVQNTEITGSSGNLLTISGQTTDATRYVELTAVAGASFADDANKTTNPLRYNASVGAAIKNSAPYGTVIVISTAHTRVSRLQLSNGTIGPTRTIDVTGANSVLDQVIVETNANGLLGGANGIARNVFVQRDGGSPIAGIGNGGSLLNCTLVRPSNLGNTTWGLINNYTTITVRNTAIFGVNNFSSVSFIGNNNASNTTIGWGTSNQASLTYADQFENPSKSGGTHDFRLKTGSALIDNGADLSGSGVTTDIVGTARGATYDIGAWEVEASVVPDDLSADSVSTDAPTVGTPTLAQIHALDAESIDVGAPTVGTPTLAQIHALDAAGSDDGAPTVGTPTLAQIHALDAAGIDAGAPTVGTPSLTLIYTLDAESIDAGAPTVGTPTLAQIHALDAESVDTGAPTVGTPSLAPTHTFDAESVSTGAPTVGQPTLAQTHALISEGVITAPPTVGAPSIAQIHALEAESISATPTVGTPALSVIDTLLAEGIESGAPTVGNPSIAQEHQLQTSNISTTNPTVGTPVLSQIYQLIAEGISAGVPTIGTPSLNLGSITVHPSRIITLSPRNRLTQLPPRVYVFTLARG